jgi:hypothetical protein
MGLHYCHALRYCHEWRHREQELYIIVMHGGTGTRSFSFLVLCSGLAAGDDGELDEPFLVALDHQWHHHCASYRLPSLKPNTDKNNGDMSSPSQFSLLRSVCSTSREGRMLKKKAEKEEDEQSVPAFSRDVRPFHVNADRMTAGQNGATFSDQSAVLIS